MSTGKASAVRFGDGVMGERACDELEEEAEDDSGVGRTIGSGSFVSCRRSWTPSAVRGSTMPMPSPKPSRSRRKMSSISPSSARKPSAIANLSSRISFRIEPTASPSRSSSVETRPSSSIIRDDSDRRWVTA